MIILVAKRFTVMSVPKDEGGAFGFIIDLQTRKSYECESFEAACLEARHRNAALNPPAYETRKALREETLRVGRDKK